MPRNTSGLKRGGPGRPKGVPNKANAEIKAVAAEHGPSAIARLAHLMLHAESEQAQVSAARELLDRAYGKPAQAVSNPDGSALNMPASLIFQIVKAEGSDCQP